MCVQFWSLVNRHTFRHKIPAQLQHRFRHKIPAQLQHRFRHKVPAQLHGFRHIFWLKFWNLTLHSNTNSHIIIEILMLFDFQIKIKLKNFVLESVLELCWNFVPESVLEFCAGMCAGILCRNVCWFTNDLRFQLLIDIKY